MPSASPLGGGSCISFSIAIGLTFLLGSLPTELGSTADPCSEVYHGPHPHSEVEVKSVADFIKKHGNFKCFIDLHSFSQMVLYPYGYTPVKAQDADELVSGICVSSGCCYSGGSRAL